MKLIALIGFALALTGGFASAQQGQVHSDCNIQVEEAARSLSCDIRLGMPETVRSASVAVGDQRLEGVEFQPYAQDETKNSAWLFLIDTSNPRRAKTVAKKLDFVKSIAARSGPRQQVGVATFANDLKEIVGLNDRNADYERRLADVKADGAATEFYAAAIQAVALLKRFDADRRVLVIMSDGKVEDKAYSRADLVKAARDADVIIYGMGYAERASETPDLQVLRRLAEDTKGPFALAVGGDDIPLRFSEDFFDYVHNGGTVTADMAEFSGEVSPTISLALSDGTSLSVSPTVFVEPQPVVEEVEEVELTPVAQIYALVDGEDKAASSWAQGNGALAWGILAAIAAAGLALLLFLFGRRRKTENTHEATPTTDTIAVAETSMDTDEPVTEVLTPGTRIVSQPVDSAVTLGWFELVDNQENRFAITKRSIEIGRHSENDFRLNNDSVHRHHANFHFSPDDKPMIVDLDTVNGVVVNGTRISKQELNSGDLIELGEVRFRYLEA